MPLPIIANDKSGGFMVLEVSNGDLVHKMRVHVAPFGTAGPLVASIPSDYSYTPTLPESTVGQTFFNLSTLLAPLWSNDYVITLARLYKNSAPGAGNGIVQAVFPTPRTPQFPCNNGSTNDYRAGQVTLSFPTADSGKARLVLLSSQEWNPSGRAALVPANVSGTPMQQLVAYLVGDGVTVSYTANSVVAGQGSIITSNVATAIVGHDGSAFISHCRRTTSLNHRVRRSLRYT